MISAFLGSYHNVKVSCHNFKPFSWRIWVLEKREVLIIVHSLWLHSCGTVVFLLDTCQALHLVDCIIIKYIEIALLKKINKKGGRKETGYSYVVRVIFLKSINSLYFNESIFKKKIWPKGQMNLGTIHPDENKSVMIIEDQES